MHKITYFSFILIFLSSACTKDKSTKLEPEEFMNIQLTTPNENQVFEFGETVSINGQITAEFTMHGYVITVLHPSFSDSIMHSYSEHVHGSQLDFSTGWTNNITESADVIIEIKAVGNHFGTADLFLRRTITCLQE